MVKNNIGRLVLVLGVASYVASCSSNDKAGAPSGTTGGASGAGGGPLASGGAGATGGSAAGGTTGTSIMTLAQACQKNCALAGGLDTCSTTITVCEQSCMTTYDNTFKVNADLGRQYTEMMVCVANDPGFASASGFTCAKPDRALNKWSPVVDPNLESPCKQKICDWNCNDGTLGNFDPWVDIPCHCSSV